MSKEYQGVNLTERIRNFVKEQDKLCLVSKDTTLLGAKKIPAKY